jgi:Lrp/AsnC family leucine-responsive transcriptional regulator
MPIDKFDLAILMILQQDARASLQEISKRVGLSSTPCWTRIKRMESEGVIQGYTVRVDPLAIGLTDTVIVQVTLESHTDETLYAFGRALEEIPEVLEAYLVSGDYDYYIRIAVKDTRDYERLLRERLYRIPGIRHSKSSFVLRTLKESLLPLSTAPVGSSVRQVQKKTPAPLAPPARARAKANAPVRRR